MEWKGNYSSRRINALAKALGARRYLEIGVAKGTTFLAVDITEKTAVDPRFQFEWSALQTEQIKFFQTTSDDYFTSHPPAQPFDIMFLDGLHEFEQLFRDFCCSLSCAHGRSVWLIDDTAPSDVYSTLRNPREAFKFRQEAGNPSHAWHGDVFKFVFAIHDFFPMLSYLTIKGRGNPQTVLWRQPRAEFQPRFNSLEAVSRLSYFDFRAHASLMNFVSEELGLDTVVRALKSDHGAADM